MQKEKIMIAASKNQHKIQEMEKIMGAMGMHVISREDAGIPDSLEIVEDGTSFEENSFKKAEAIMKFSSQTAVADDSGLMVDALDGAPGVYSARFAGEPCDDQKNNEKLLKLLEDVPDEKRTAKFVSVITVVYPDGTKLTARGECPGSLLREGHGCNGFGYDPLFVPDGYDQTFAQLPAEVKNRISHRAKALQHLEQLLKEKDL
ncbi:MAG: XTP/dITP diphosphatase [Eubacterium sp.]|jgi:XTP/dITP diphosphohydrolase|nr:XTP/dITP diphosphatase [Eubacterium sp.]MCH4047554.1 XTP/dITP diphosphatase [Eubacterium sp.]MCH4078325.1 XTP/dITP diphosphatase [Eubacterium sp.]MCH4109472.1 XTP/dITP diphosphatase [Eubacterium sp.]MCI1307625.1 XTP/dITP diphosphatase [Eubacterium sp.]